MKFIPLATPDITDRERKAVQSVLRTRFLSRGPKLHEFEKKNADYLSVRYAVATNSATSALHLAIRCLNIKEGDHVITTPMSFIASANCIMFERATPVFVDVEPRTHMIDPRKAEEKIKELRAQGKSVKAILAVDLFGYLADWKALRAIAKQYHLALIEDSCEALGSSMVLHGRPRMAGTLGDIGTFAFSANKQLSTGEGGILVTNKRAFADRARSMKSHGLPPNKPWGAYEELGYNYHMNEITCALGIAQLDRIEELIAKRMRIAAAYDKRLGSSPLLHIPPWPVREKTMSRFVYVIRLADQFSPAQRDRLIALLGKKGIESRPYFPAIHLTPFYRKKFGYKRGDFPVAEHFADRALALPFSSTFTIAQIDNVCYTLLKVLKHYNYMEVL